jgi:hypothetical protein
MTNEQIQRGITEYVQRYKYAEGEEAKRRISMEVGLYLTNVTETQEDFMFYASEYVCRTHQITLIDKIKKALEDFV